MTPQRLFLYRKIEVRSRKGGIYAFLYRDKILLPLLYPFYEEVQKANLDKQVWLIEDNASAHTLAAKQCAEDRKIRGIKKIDWLPNSPDLHAIETLWHAEKPLISPQGMQLKGAGKEAQKKAREIIYGAWNSVELKDKAKQICAGWLDKLKLCRDHEGDNNFNG